MSPPARTAHIQLFPPLDARELPSFAHASGLLAVEADAELVVDRSEIVITGEDGRDLGVLRGEDMGCARGRVFTGPGFWHLGDGAARPPPGAAAARWRLGELVSNAVALDGTGSPGAGSPMLRLDAIPFQVGAPYEPHLVLHVYNAGPAPLDIAAALQRSTLLIDDRRAPHLPTRWDGSSRIHPGRARRIFLSLDHYDPSARRGRHRVQIECAGDRSNVVEIA
jgi:hypothetical protein